MSEDQVKEIKLKKFKADSERRMIFMNNVLAAVIVVAIWIVGLAMIILGVFTLYSFARFMVEPSYISESNQELIKQFTSYVFSFAFGFCVQFYISHRSGK